MQTSPAPHGHRLLIACLGSVVLAILLVTLSVASPLASVAPAAVRPASEQIIYQQGVSPWPEYSGASDTFISRLGDEIVNYGDQPLLALHSGDQRSALLRFELDGLSPGDSIQRATLSLYVSDHPTGTADLPISVYRVLRPWAETEATWYNATASVLWTLAGCNSPATDRASTPSASATITTTGAWVDLDVTALVQRWVSEPADNLGLIIKAGNPVSVNPAQSGDQYVLRSAQYADEPTIRPKLAVSFVPAGAGSPTPTPTTVYGSPTSVVFQQNVSPGQYAGTFDTFISDYGDPDRNYGGDSALRLRSNDHRASLIRFDLTSVPSSAYVYSAALSLYSQSRTNINPLPISAHRLLRPWGDMEATWNIAASGRRWAFPGANGLTTDRAPDAFATLLLSSTGIWTTWDVTALAQDWVDNSTGNYGIILKAGSGTQVEYSLVASHHLANASLRPKLEIVYALPDGPTPVPTETRTPSVTPTPSRTPSVSPTIVVFQQGRAPDSGYSGVADTLISREGDLTANFGWDATLTIGANDTQAALLRFDLSRIPPWVTVQYARLALFSDGASNGYPMAVSAYQVLHPWVEMEATWMNRTSTMQWIIPGANGLGLDRLATASAVRTVGTRGDWYEFDITTMAAAWIASPDDNFGLILKGMSGPQVSYDFLSSQHQVAQGVYYRPQLVVAYTVPPGPTPTPTHTRTPTPTATRAFTYLPVIFSLFEPPVTQTPTPTASPIVSPTPTASPTATFSPTATASLTPTRIPLTIVFRQDTSPYPWYAGVGDTYLSDYEAGDNTTNFADSDVIALRGDNRRVGLMRFDVATIPVTATVLMASLSLYADSATPVAASLAVSAHEMLRPWVAAEATWLRASAAAPWAGASAASDRNPQPAASQTLAQAEAWVDFDLRDLVQSWVSRPGTNRGIMLATAGSSASEYLVRSSQYANTSFRPKLVVTYVP